MWGHRNFWALLKEMQVQEKNAVRIILKAQNLGK
jgi:hypothetical protein